MSLDHLDQIKKISAAKIYQCEERCNSSWHDGEFHDDDTMMEVNHRSHSTFLKVVMMMIVMK